MFRKTMLPLVAVAALVAGGAPALAAGMDATGSAKAPAAAVAKPMAKDAGTVSLRQAILRAENKTGGKAVSATAYGPGRRMYRIEIDTKGVIDTVTFNGKTGHMEIMTAEAGSMPAGRAK